MTPADLVDPDLAHQAEDLRRRGEAFAIATVIRTAGATAAKPGAKALIAADGTTQQGWLGGGCVRAALAKAAKRALESGAPELVSLLPEDLLAERGVAAGEAVAGVRFARNACPSQGSMDIFVEPVLPMPELVIFGESPVARALARLAEGFQWSLRRCAGEATTALPPSGARRMIVVATQGKADQASLRAALAAEAEFVAFVGSRRKFAALSETLIAAGVAPEALAKVQAPAGLAIDAVTPEEIGLSILAQLTQLRRRAQRGGGDGDA
ncbi:MAG: hypothetical protein Kilf2KO_10930 [Rhodospirillales bacterium]